MEEKKEEFLAEGGNIIDFHYSTPLNKQFSSTYFDYREKRNDYYKRLKKDLNQNLNIRLELIEGISSQHIIFDLIYNPEETRLMKLASVRGAKTLNGYKMLELQAEKSWSIWNS